jgi:predicted MFS family arabinose efflux permease
MANAGYAVGTVLAVQFAQHLPQRRMLLVCGLLLWVYQYCASRPLLTLRSPSFAYRCCMRVLTVFVDT